MYNDKKPKSTLPPTYVREEYSAEPAIRPPTEENIGQLCGDIEQQLLRLDKNVNEAEKFVAELYEKVNPILLPKSCKDECNKDCVVEKTLSPLANDVRSLNLRLESLKLKMMDLIVRIQL